MNFFSIEFALFFLSIVILFFLIPFRHRRYLLIISSVTFYGLIDLRFLPVLIIPSIIVFVLSSRISTANSAGKRKTIFLITLCVPLLSLIIFKYFDFFINIITSVFPHSHNFGAVSTSGIFFPVGISFYSFKIISYIIDVYTKKTDHEKNFSYYFLYISFFPQILAGPIDRAGPYIEKLKKPSTPDLGRILEGAERIIFGIFKKAVVADRLAVFVNNTFQNPAEVSGITLIAAAYFYSFQIYCDFSGYSDIAIGMSGIFGYKSMENFNFPYISKSFSEFWRRWHISLSEWIRDYLFLPISYAFLRRIKSLKILFIKTDTLAYFTGVMTAMALTGLWHGAGWTFIIWGVLHGFFLFLGQVTRRRKKRIAKKLKLSAVPRLYNAIKILITFNLLTFTWIIFRSSGISETFSFLKNIGFDYNGEGAGYIIFNIILILFFIATETIHTKLRKKEKSLRIPVFVKVTAYAFFICLIIILYVTGPNEFIYFGF